jgi:hypothetical protein
MSVTPFRDAAVETYKRLSSDTIRKTELNLVPHFVPLDLKTLNLTLSKAIVQDPSKIAEYIQDPELYKQAVEAGIDFSDKAISMRDLQTKIQSYAETRHKNRLDISKGSAAFKINNLTNIPVSQLLDKEKKLLPARVYSNGELVGVLYYSFDAAYAGLFKDFLNKEISKFIDSTIYEGTNFRKGFDVGHILGDTELARSPIGIKLKRMLDALSSITEDIELQIPGYKKTNKSNINKLVSDVTNNLNTLHQKSSYGQSIEVELDKDFGIQPFLLSVRANIVIIQDRIENQQIYGNMVEGLIERDVGTLLAKANFSNNLIQELALRLSGVIQGKTAFKKELKNKKVPKINVPVKTGKVSTKSAKKSKIALGTLPTGPQKLSLTNLQSLLDATLVQRVKQNMGSGTSRTVLNLRTGRFAESVQVERLSESRAGMITAFYSYMKNPYATFSQGGQQQNPRSRDPKLLISKSIREIAAQQVGNRLRAVNI